MTIYQNLGKTNENGLELGTVSYLFKIKFATLLESAYAKQDALGLDLESKDAGVYGAHWIIGKELYREFLGEMNVEESEIEKLVGKKVIGFVNKNSPVLRGIKVK